MLRYVWLAAALACLCSAPATAQQAVSSLPDTERRIAITIDDAPLGPGAKGDWDRTGSLIEGLNTAGVQAVFFVLVQTLVLGVGVGVTYRVALQSWKLLERLRPLAVRFSSVPTRCGDIDAF